MTALFPLHVVRHLDLLVLHIELENLEPSQDLQRLVRGDATQPAWISIQFPPQHVCERVFLEAQGHQEPADAPPVDALAAGPTRLVFELPLGQADVPLALVALLDWEGWIPRLAPAALPAGAPSGPPRAAPALDQTAIEFPQRLVLSPDSTGRWVHRQLPFSSGGSTEIWHTQLRPAARAHANAPATLRALARRAGANGFTSAPSDDELDQIVLLTSDFDIRPRPWRELHMKPLDWIRLVAEVGGGAAHYVPQPLQAERFMLSALGASVRLQGTWDYPACLVPGRPEPKAETLQLLHMPLTSVTHYAHVAGLGRDEHVEVVHRGFVSTGHRAALIIVTERHFEPRTDAGPGPLFASNAYLRQHCIVVIEQPLLDYAALSAGYEYGGREMPLRSIEIVTRCTPRIDSATKCSATNPFWIQVSGADFAFHVIATDWDGQQVTLTMPLLFVPYEQSTSKDVTVLREAFDKSGRAQLPLHGKVLALADPSGTGAGSTRLPVESLTFTLKAVAASLPSYQPSWVLGVVKARVHLDAIERITGTRGAVDVAFHTLYLHGLPNHAGIFASLTPPLALAFGGDRGGGLARPDALLECLSSRRGVIPAAFAEPSAANADLKKAFGEARLFGSIALSSILAEFSAEPSAFTTDELTEAELRAPGMSLRVPRLQTRTLLVDGKPAIEARYLWAPALQNPGTFLKLDPEASLLLEATALTLAGASPRSEVRGVLRNFALEFGGVVSLHFEVLEFRASSGAKSDISANGLNLRFLGALAFINTLRQLFPVDGFHDPPAVEVTPDGISAGYSLGIPNAGVGIFALQNLSLSALLAVPFGERPANFRFAISERHHPFLVTVTLFGGGGFCALGVGANGVESVEAAIEFGGSFSLDLGVASGGVHVLAGVYFGMVGSEVSLTGYVRCGGYLSVLGIISISIEFYLAFNYAEHDGQTEVWGQASVSVSVKLACFSKSVSLTLERRFAGAAADPLFEDVMELRDWDRHCRAFAA